jgi:hypothetical protein
MPQQLRIDDECTIYHVMAQGNARQKNVRDDTDRRRLIDGLERPVACHNWERHHCVAIHSRAIRATVNRCW